MRAALCACLLAVSMTATPAPAQMLDFEALDGWPEDNHRAALTAFLGTCDKLDAPDWQPICRLPPMQARQTPRRKPSSS